MITQKAGTILLNLQTKQIGLVYRTALDDYSFPKGHLEIGETLEECAIRETEEETLRKNHLYSTEPISIERYTTPRGEEVENHLYIAIDDGPTEKEIALKDRENLTWFNLEDVENALSYEDLKALWNSKKSEIEKVLSQVI